MSLLDLIFPTKCIVCNEISSHICPKCTRKLHRALPECFYCRRISNLSRSHIGDTPPPLKAVITLYTYSIYAKTFMNVFKYRSQITAAKTFPYLISHHGGDTISQCDLITFIPIHKHRARQRGYNQAEVIAQAIAKLYNKPCRSTLTRKTYRKSQAKLSKDEREKNINQAFETRPWIKLRDLKILIVDDVITTGVTLESASEILLAGSENCELYGFALFRGKPPAWSSIRQCFATRLCHLSGSATQSPINGKAFRNKKR